VSKDQIVSRQRVTDHGEVYTSEREVNAMLDMVKQETERIDSRFLEPACGTGNFLTEILRRKLSIVKDRYRKNQLDYERNAVVAVSSIYGVDILKDNVITCRQRLFDIFNDEYTAIFKEKVKEACSSSVRFILSQNMLWGDSLTLKTVGEDPKLLVFPEWSPVNSKMMKRRDFEFGELVDSESSRDNMDLFNPEVNQSLKSDEGEDIFLPRPIKEHPLVHFLEISDAE
jgi:hypothetical protein